MTTQSTSTVPAGHDASPTRDQEVVTNNNDDNNNDDNNDNTDSLLLRKQPIPSLDPVYPEHHLPHASHYPRTWSTSNDWKGNQHPELTSNECSQALRSFFLYTDQNNQNPLLALAAESSSHPSGLLTLFAQPYVYAGGGLGNMHECPRNHHHHHNNNNNNDDMSLQTCLAGGTKRDSLTFASVCIVPECTALDLASDDFVGVLERAAGTPETRTALATSYIQLHSTIAELNMFLKTGWTCGEYRVLWRPFPFGVPYGMVMGGVVLASLVATCCSSRNSTGVRRRRRKRQSKGASSPMATTTTATAITDHGTSVGMNVPVSRHSHDTEPLFQSQESYDYDEKQEEKKDQSTPWSYGYYLGKSKGKCELCDNDDDCQSKRTQSSLLQAWNVPMQLQTLNRHRPETAALDGLRVMSILWIVLGHVMAIQSSSGGGYSNPKDFLPPNGLTTKLGGQLLFASRFAVDTFLILSGFLVVHVMMSKLPPAPSDTADRFWFVWNYFQTIPTLLLHRVLRIMPLYAMSLGFWTQVAPFLGSGPFWYQWEPLLESCRQFGWTNLLFVNNFFPWNLANTETCFYHSWYLAVDVQLFVLAPLLVGWYRQSRKGGEVATAVLLVLSIAMTLYLAFVRKWSLNTFDGAAVARFDVEGYAKPHVRAQSYLTGMLLAMWLNSSALRGTRPCTPNWRHRFAMMFALVLLAFVTFCTVTGAYSRRPCRYVEWPFLDECGSTWSPTATFLYAGMSRAVWAVAIAVIVTLCLKQQGGLVGDFLSWKGWTPLSNLSFGAYLVHPIVIFVWQLGGSEKETFRLFVFGMNYVSVCVVSFAASLLLSLLIELPCATLVRQHGERLLSSVCRRTTPLKSEDDFIQLLSSQKDVASGEVLHYGSVGELEWQNK